MKEKLIIGIDPGKTGAIASVLASEGALVDDMPILGKRVNACEIFDMLEHMKITYDAVAFIERAQAMPKQGVSSTFNYGVGYGILLGVLQALKIPISQEVSPRVWKQEFGLIGTDKEASRSKAVCLFPGLAGELKLKKHHGRAEALLIAEYGRRKELGLLSK